MPVTDMSDPEAIKIQLKLLERRKALGLPEHVIPNTRGTQSISTSVNEEVATILSMHQTCREHGETEPCPLCESERREEAEQKARARELSREAKAKEAWENPEPAMREAGVGLLYLKCSLETFEGAPEVKAALEAWITKPDNLVLFGNPGCGKTHMAVSLVRMLCQRQQKALFVKVNRLLLAIRESMRDPETMVSTLINRYTRVPYLFLDDMGADKYKDWSISTLYLIIDERLSECLPTVVTTNLSLDDIGSFLSEPIASRLAAGRIVKMSMPDYRKRRPSPV
jgi:DNA replication protein DnaC